ncbi:hypothetical protein FOG51_02485 [Hanseniaspora uvarum]|uniref:peptidylprolyl isomerase n=1 Tax=Hanseniaspora uvarum TaxID=29833 RepID=A0A1E5S1N0_HANUV|nr:hypothetical protein FOG48_02160 [Hanseniaspora uvarum]KKA01095.1 Peptidyl-prolyl cis-trans isomerase HuFPR2 [Hanseniaspora uvarum DSM 2768]KAF0272761.1 hypothetical protein FOG51_02485 [Hanseniaspora uvarum]KAF0278258.1 hypothetical protein FOG50_00889 [Hanseniaspora uvarum]OEJ92873.1 FK506-binding protein 2 [Hanseniaspora uvarum]
MQLSFIITSFLAFFLALAQAGELTELEIKTVKSVADCKQTAQKGDLISVHYTGSLLSDGTVFDSSINRGQPIQFTLGVGQVIKGWDEGLIGACVGEKRDLYIPSALGYGSRGAGNVIPPNADLLFETELVAVK